MPTTRRQAAPSRTVVVASTAQAYIAGAAIHADLTTRKPVALDVAYPLSASDNRVLKLSSGGPLSLTLRDATDVPAEYANGFLVYRGGMRAGAHVIVRPLENGFEDYFFFENKPDTNR